MPGPIGIFDSGYGGLTVLKAIKERLPDYDYLYLGDNARTPYGNRSYEVVHGYTLQAVKYLFSQGCELVILACNTASAKALRTIQQKDLPQLAPDKRVLGVIRPSTERVGELSASKHVGILATEGTVRSNSYVLEIARFSPRTKVTQEACPIWVPIIENNLFKTNGGKFFINHHLQNLLKADSEIDLIVLGCTHYPIIQPMLQELVPEGVRVLAQGDLVAQSLEDYLKRHPEMAQRCTINGQIRYLTTEHPKDFNRKAREFNPGIAIEAEKVELNP